jgi:transmembrane sensor
MSTMNIREEREACSVREQAAEWLLILEDGKAEDRIAFAEWLKKSPLHIDAFLRAAAMDALLSRVDSGRTLALERQVKDDGLDVAPVQQPYRVASDSGSRIALHWAAAASVALIAIASLAWWKTGGYLARLPAQDFRTDIGEQRVLELEDGSVLHLNTNSKVKVHFSARERKVELLVGEALFRVHRDPSRPFKVQSGSAIIEAVGTQFDVYRRQDDAVVSVIEGVVQVSNEMRRFDDSAPPVRLNAGEQVRVSHSGSVLRKNTIDTGEIGSWRQRRLIFKDEPLTNIAAEFNRYNRTPKIRIQGEGIGERRYAAAFDADDPESLMGILAKDPALEVEQRNDELVVRSRPNTVK